MHSSGDEYRESEGTCGCGRGLGQITESRKKRQKRIRSLEGKNKGDRKTLSIKQHESPSHQNVQVLYLETRIALAETAGTLKGTLE